MNLMQNKLKLVQWAFSSFNLLTLTLTSIALFKSKRTEDLNRLVITWLCYFVLILLDYFSSFRLKIAFNVLVKFGLKEKLTDLLNLKHNEENFRNLIEKYKFKLKYCSRTDETSTRYFKKLRFKYVEYFSNDYLYKKTIRSTKNQLVLVLALLNNKQPVLLNKIEKFIYNAIIRMIGKENAVKLLLNETYLNIYNQNKIKS
jgi:hypothetical protein